VRRGRSRRPIRDTAALFKALAKSTALTSCNLSHNGLVAASGVALAAALKENHSLVALNLSDNLFDESVGTRLAVTLKTNTTLQVLLLHRNRLAAGAEAIVGALHQNRTTKLRELGLISTAARPQLATVMCQLLKSQEPAALSLTLLDVSGNAIGAQAAAAMDHACEKRFSLHRVVVKIRHQPLHAETLWAEVVASTFGLRGSAASHSPAPALVSPGADDYAPPPPPPPPHAPPPPPDYPRVSPPARALPPTKFSVRRPPGPSSGVPPMTASEVLAAERAHRLQENLEARYTAIKRRALNQDSTVRLVGLMTVLDARCAAIQQGVDSKAKRAQDLALREPLPRILELPHHPNMSVEVSVKVHEELPVIDLAPRGLGGPRGAVPVPVVPTWPSDTD